MIIHEFQIIFMCIVTLKALLPHAGRSAAMSTESANAYEAGLRAGVKPVGQHADVWESRSIGQSSKLSALTICGHILDLDMLWI